MSSGKAIIPSSSMSRVSPNLVKAITAAGVDKSIAELKLNIL